MQINPARLRAAITRMRRSDRAIAIGALVLFASLFLPWFGLGFLGSASGISAHGWLFLVMLACLGVLGYLAWVAARPRASLAPAHWQGLIAAAGFASFLTLLGVLISPAGSSLEVGAFVALAGAGTALTGAIATRLAIGREPASDDDGQRPDLRGLAAGLARRWSAPPQVSTPGPVARPPGGRHSSGAPQARYGPVERISADRPPAAAGTAGWREPVSPDGPPRPEMPPSAPKITAPTSVTPTAVEPKPKGRGGAGGGWLAAIAAVAALIAWLTYYRPVSTNGLQAQQVASLNQFQPPAPVHVLGTTQGLIGLGAAVALLIAAALLIAGRRRFVLLLTASASGILLADGLSVVHPAEQAAASWANLASQLAQIQASNGSAGPLSGLVSGVFASIGIEINAHSVLPGEVVVAAGALGLLGSLIALVRRPVQAEAAQHRRLGGRDPSDGHMRVLTVPEQGVRTHPRAAGSSEAAARQLMSCTECSTALLPEDDFCTGCGWPAGRRPNRDDLP